MQKPPRTWISNATPKQGELVRVRAQIESITTLSAHGDYEDVLKWLGTMQGAPVRTFVTHGEPAAADALRRRIADTLHWTCEVPVYEQCVDLNEGDEGDGLHQEAAEAEPADAARALAVRRRGRRDATGRTGYM